MDLRLEATADPCPKAPALANVDVSRSGLEAYEDLWRRSEGRRVSWNKKVRTIYNSLNDGELNRVILSLQSEDTGSLGCEGCYQVGLSAPFQPPPEDDMRIESS
jgi:hypothetical protein